MQMRSTRKVVILDDDVIVLRLAAPATQTSILRESRPQQERVFSFGE